jgi:ADP-ribose pyrophosphatase
MLLVVGIIICAIAWGSTGQPDGRRQIGAVVLLGIALVICWLTYTGFMEVLMKGKEEKAAANPEAGPAQGQAGGGSPASGGGAPTSGGGTPAAPSDPMDAYAKLVADRPELFVQDPAMRVVTDREQIERFAKDHGRTMGVVYASAYNIGLVDLVEKPGGERFAYERVVPAQVGTPVVVVTMSRQGEFVLLRQFRHAIRRYQLAFPRGFGENGLSVRENAMKELLEELNAEVVGDMVLLGTVCPDSGLTSAGVDVFLCVVDSFTPSHDEGIVGTRVLSGVDLREMVRKGEIDDGFTLSALAMLEARLRSGDDLTELCSQLVAAADGAASDAPGDASPA